MCRGPVNPTLLGRCGDSRLDVRRAFLSRQPFPTLSASCGITYLEELSRGRGRGVAMVYTASALLLSLSNQHP